MGLDDTPAIRHSRRHFPSLPNFPGRDGRSVMKSDWVCKECRTTWPCALVLRVQKMLESGPDHPGRHHPGRSA